MNPTRSKKMKPDKSSMAVRVVMRGGGSLVNCRPIFSRDCKYLICASGCVLQVYSVENDVCCKSMVGHGEAVTCIATNPKNEFQVFSSSLDKNLICWDYVDGVILHRYKFSHPVLSFFPSGEYQAAWYGVIQVDNDPRNSRLVEFDVRNSQDDRQVEFQKLHFGVPSYPRRIAASCKGSFLAFIRRRTNVFVVDHGQAKSYEFQAKETLTCIACHPNEYCIATGTKGGSIYLWRNFNLSVSDLVCTELHWHSLDVFCLAFSVEGSYLLSGGHECVLVKWMTDSASKTPADTLPRLSSKLVNISCSPDNKLYAVSYADNGIQIIGNNFFRGPAIQGLVSGHCQSFRKKIKVDDMMNSVGLLCDPRTGCMVTNGRPGQLQFFNIDVNRQLFSLNVVGHNYVSPENLNKPLQPTNVEKVAFDSLGNWMVTFERRDDGVMAPEARLKFWHYSTEKSTFVLNTCVDMPHHGKLSSLKFRPNHLLEEGRSSSMVVSTSVDGSIKVWSLINEDNSLRWSCAGVGVYRGQAAGPLDFSQDGSVLAVAFKDVITLWYPSYCCMLDDVISIPDDKSMDITLLTFGCQTSSHLLVFYTPGRLFCWNMLSFSLQWSMQLSVATLVASPFSDVMAIFTSDQQLMVLSPRSTVIYYKRQQISKEPVLMACFLPLSERANNIPWQSKARLHFMTANQEIYSIMGKEEIKLENQKTAPLQRKVEKTSILSMLIEPEAGGGRALAVEGPHKYVLPARSKFIEEVLNYQFIAMPPVSLLCTSFMETLLIKKSVTGGTEDSDVDSDSDEKELNSINDDSDMDTL